MNTEHLDELERKLEKAMPGPWCGFFLFPENHTEANYDLVDAAINALPALISDSRRLEQAEREKEELKAELEQWRSDNPPDYEGLRVERARSQSLQEEVERLRGVAGDAAWRFDQLNRQFAKNLKIASLAPTFKEAADDIRAALTPTEPKTGGEG